MEEKRKLKKVIAMILTSIILLSCVGALAEEETNDTYTVTSPSGMKLTINVSKDTVEIIRNDGEIETLTARELGQIYIRIMN